MKKTISILLSILSLTLFTLLPIYAAQLDLVVDDVGLLTDQEYVELNNLAIDITEQYQCEVSIIVIEDRQDDEIIDYAKYVYEEYDYGYGEEKSGLMLFISMKERDYTLITYGYGNIAFTDHAKNVLTDEYLIPYISKDEYYQGFLSYLNQTAEFLNMAENGTPFDLVSDENLMEENESNSFWLKLTATIVIPLLIAGFISFAFLRQMKTVIPEKAAKNYISKEGLNLTMESDEFLYETETRTEINDNSSSGGSSVGNDSYSSDKGKF